MTLTQDQVVAAAEEAKAQANAARLAAVCPDAADEFEIAERKAAEAAANAQAKREAKYDAVQRLVKLAVGRARELSYADMIRGQATVDLKALGASAAQALMDSKRSPCAYSESLYQNLANDLVRLNALQPYLQDMLKGVEADCAAQLSNIKLEAKKEGIALKVLLDLLKRDAGLNELRNANKDPELLSLFENGYFAGIE